MKSIINKLKRGMRIQFPDGSIEVVLATEYIGKSEKFPNKKGSHYFCTDQRICCGWKWDNFLKGIKILGYSNYIHRFDKKRVKENKFLRRSF